MVSKKKISERRRSLNLNNNNNNEEEMKPPPALIEQMMMAEAVPEGLAVEPNPVQEVADDTLLLDTKVEPVSNNVNSNNIEEKAQPFEEAVVPEKPIEEKAQEEVPANNVTNEPVQVLEEKQPEPEPEKPVRTSPVKIKIRVNPEPNTNNASEKEEKGENAMELSDQNDIELINPWEMLVIKW